jgi:rRNA pseudouridine-1189 N-methylase Emg1 (Nep1/Mra1 family)
MKYKKFKVLLRGLLHGDNIVPSDDETLLGLVEYSLSKTLNFLYFIFYFLLVNLHILYQS